ncbi:TauD/TfdA family dioxygenase [Paenibacillus sp. ClWae2A]|uniref:TauD/TfdA family dioxygenase n=1 Tax=unclassified Paenibacillus TaxID=185978 RepID=UPI000884E0FF|nr:MULTISPECIES: TauD/TfdA family dioxygenase [unclassified Paenibacillus]MDT9721663.1 TauD/TfdA family dioxygenase [Paenibacillus sp. ClWae2A]SDM17235.1 Taurine dioxygenase, alpha-ketoglutarate-dependent [Paenibacillus sp. OK060]
MMNVTMENITMDYLQKGETKITVLDSKGNVDDFYGWALHNKSEIEKLVLQYGGVLFRNFNVSSIDLFEKFSTIFTPELEKYKERSTPRSEVKGNVYTSTEYPEDQHIAMHNENSYAHVWAQKIFFHCVQPSEVGGETPIADSRAILNQLNPDLKDKFATKQVLYQRNIGGNLDLPWEEVFQTNSKQEVEEYCSNAGINIEWFSDGRLRTKAIRPAVAKHPQTEEMVWFNQAHLFHVTNLSPAIREYLVQTVGESNLPRNTYYGDGDTISDEDLQEIRNVYDEHSLAFPWEKGDVLMLDNMLMAHGRRPYKGARKIVVTMGDLTSNYGI